MLQCGGSGAGRYWCGPASSATSLSICVVSGNIGPCWTAWWAALRGALLNTNSSSPTHSAELHAALRCAARRALDYALGYLLFGFLFVLSFLQVFDWVQGALLFSMKFTRTLKVSGSAGG